MKRKPDRRVLRTRRQLREAMLALIVEQPYDSITIEALTDRADLNRATFYLHYGSKEELLFASLETLFDELVASFAKFSPEQPIWQESNHMLLMFEHVAEHIRLYKVILSEKGLGYVINRILDYMAAVSMAVVEASLAEGDVLLVPQEIICRHVAGSQFSLLSWWVANDMPHSAEYMADICKNLCEAGVGAFAPVNQMAVANPPGTQLPPV